MRKRDLPISAAAVAYGETVYWLTIIAAFIVILGTLLSFVSMNQILTPSYLLTAVLEGNTVNEIWINSPLQAVPQKHWYLSSLGSGEGLMTLGIATGVFSIIPATAIATLCFWHSRNRLFAALAGLACAITVISMVGWISIPI